jgi:class 3 adenylate cyclase
VLFTDIVGSTEQAARLGDSRWRDLLNSHDRLLRSHLVRYEGEEVQFTGDGMLALFADPTSALDCAEALTSATRQIGLEIRVGIHSGMIEVRGGDVAGMAVHIAARVMAAASASEVLITRTVRDLLVGADLQLQPRGPRDFKGLTEPIEIYALESG